MKRRKFLQMATATIIGSKFLKASEIHQHKTDFNPFIVSFANRESDIQRALEQGLQELGGIENYLFRRCRVLIKPTMAWNQEPGTGYNSDPVIVKMIIELCYKAGAREVALFDNTFDEWALTYKNSGIERVAKDAAARVIPANHIRYYKPLNKAGMQSSKLLVHEALVNANVVINLPVVKQRLNIPVSGAIANYMGCTWNRSSCPDENSECLSDLLHFKKPHLNISEIWPERIFNPEMATSDAFRAFLFSHSLIGTDVISARLLNIENEKISGLMNALKLYPNEASVQNNQIKYV
jgi:uncharacterized protein (DUF362 family)